MNATGLLHEKILADLRGNLRLQWLLIAVATVLAWLLIDLVWETRNNRIAEGQKLADQYQEFLALRTETQWAERAGTTEALLESLRAEIPSANSPGVAQATLQSWLQARVAGMDRNPTFSVDPAREVESTPGIYRVRGTVAGTSELASVLDLLSRIETSPNLLVVDSLTVNSETQRGFSITLSAYFKIAPQVEQQQ